jgi:hypothetical protein
MLSSALFPMLCEYLTGEMPLLSQRDSFFAKGMKEEADL